MNNQKHITQLSAAVSAAALLALGLPGTARGEQQVTARLDLPMQVNGTVTASDCDNAPGPQVTLDGEIQLGDVAVQLIFQNNLKGTHTTNVTYSSSVVLVPLGGAITIPKQPALLGVGGNPHIWIQFHDGEGTDLTEEIYLGRCVQGLSISPSFLHEVIAAADVATADCKNRKGPYITVGGTITFSGLHARFIFRNNLKGTQTFEDMRDVSLIIKGSQVVIPKQPVRGGAGGNPLIGVQFLQGGGQPVGTPVMLGRCNQI